jgi:peptidyl-prolyl cis-trans isomerase C
MLLAFAAVLSAQLPTMSTPPPPSAATPTGNPNEIVLTIGNRQITAALYEALVRMLLPPQQQEFALGAGRRQIAQKLVEISALADQAAKLGLDKQPDTAAMLAFQRDNLLAAAMFQQFEQTATVSDADLQAYYDAHKSDYEAVTARHIMIRVKGAPFPAVPGKPELSDDEARAKAESIRQRIAGGEDFAKIAKEESDDTASGEKGGDMGEVKRNQQVPPLERAIYALKAGDISEPVRTPFGYHIIQVQSHTLKSLADVKQDILAQLKPDLARKTVNALVNNTKFDINESFFGPAPAAVAGATGGKQ